MEIGTVLPKAIGHFSLVSFWPNFQIFPHTQPEGTFVSKYKFFGYYPAIPNSL
jgi:hypothetical protein